MPSDNEKKDIPFYKRSLIARSGNQEGRAVVEGSDDDEDFKAFVQRKLFAKAAQEEAAAKSLKRSAIDAIAEPLSGQMESLGLRAMGRGNEADAVLRLSEARAGAAMDRVPEMSKATGIPEIVVKGGLAGASSLPYSIPAIAGGPIGIGLTASGITATGVNSAKVEGQDAGLRGGSLALSSGLKGTSDTAAMLVMQKLNLPGLEGIFGKVGKAGAAQSIGKGIADGLRRFGRANIEEGIEEQTAMVWQNLLSQWDGTAGQDLTLESLYEQALDTAAATFAQVSAFSAVAEGTKLYRDQKFKKELANKPSTPPPVAPSSPNAPADAAQPPDATPPTAGQQPAQVPGPAGKAFPIDMQIETIDGILADGQPRTLEELGVEIAKLGLNPESFLEGLAGASKQAAMGGKYEQTDDGKVYLATEEEQPAAEAVDTVPPSESQPDQTETTPPQAIPPQQLTQVFSDFGQGITDGLYARTLEDLNNGKLAEMDKPPLFEQLALMAHSKGLIKSTDDLRVLSAGLTGTFEEQKAKGIESLNKLAAKYGLTNQAEQPVESASPTTPEPAAPTPTEPTPSVDIRESMWKGYSEKSGDLINDPVIAAAQYIEGQRGRAFNRDEFEQFADAFTTAEPGDARMEVAATFIGSSARKPDDTVPPSEPVAAPEPAPAPPAKAEGVGSDEVRRRTINQLYDQKAVLQSRYNTMSKGLDTPGVDTKAIKQSLETISLQMSEVERQLDTLEGRSTPQTEPPAPKAGLGKPKPVPAGPRAMTNDGRAVDGGPINAGDTFQTSSGRVTTPYPKISTKQFTKRQEVQQNEWLLDNVRAEAEARGDDFNVTVFRGEDPKNLPPASIAAAQEYLFGEQPAVPKPFLNPLVTPKQPEQPKPQPPEGYKPLAEFRPSVTSIKSPDLAMADNIRSMKELQLQPGEAVGYRVYPDKKSIDGAYWQYGTIEPSASTSHATIRRPDGTKESVGGERIIRLTKVQSNAAEAPAKPARRYPSALNRYPDKIPHPDDPNRTVDTPPVYLTGKSTPETRAAAKDTPNLGVLVTPATAQYRNHLDDYQFFGVDNGAFSGKFDEKAFYQLLENIRKGGHADKALFAAAPDVVGDWQATLARSEPHLDRIRDAGFPVAIVLQNGATVDTVPWERIDALFVGGNNSFKLGTKSENPKQIDPKAEMTPIIREALKRKIPIHYGRVNSASRLEITHFGGVGRSVDGTFLKFGLAGEQLSRIQSWLKPWGKFPQPLADTDLPPAQITSPDGDTNAKTTPADATLDLTVSGQSRPVPNLEANQARYVVHNRVGGNPGFRVIITGQHQGQPISVSNTGDTPQSAYNTAIADFQAKIAAAPAENEPTTASPPTEESDLKAMIRAEMLAQMAAKESATSKPNKPRKPSLGRPATPPKDGTSKPAKPKQTLEEKQAAAKARAQALLDQLNDMQTKLTSGLDPAMAKVAVQYALAELEAGTLTFAVYAKQIWQSLPAQRVAALKPYLEMAWEVAHDMGKAKDPVGDINDHQPTPQTTNPTDENNDTEEAGPQSDDDIQADTRNGVMADGTGPSDRSMADGDAGQDRRPDAQGGAGRPGEGVSDANGSNPQADERPEPIRNGKRNGLGSNPAGGQEPEMDGSATPDQGAASQSETVSGTDPDSLNHRIGPNDTLAVSGIATSYKLNVAAIQLIKQLDTEGRNATPFEKTVLARFSGWGGLAPVFDEDRARQWEHYQKGKEERPYGYHYIRPEIENWAKDWHKRYTELKEVLTETEWQAARNSTTNAHYTARPVVEAMWAIAEKLGFQGGKVAEFGAGIGHFAGLMPESVANKSKFLMVEMDAMSARIATKLYPQAEVIAKDLAAVDIRPSSVSMVIGNFPFSEIPVDDAKERYGISLNLHNYMFARAADALPPGGIAIVISTHNTLDAQAGQRKFLGERLDLLGAIRLPNNAFAENAKTKVTTDILVFRKKEGGRQVGEDMASTEKVTMLNRENAKVPIAINSYFVKYPKMALGIHSAKGQLRGKTNEYSLDPDPTITDLAKAIADAAEIIKPPSAVAVTSTSDSAVLVDNADVGADGFVRMDGTTPMVYAGGRWMKIGEGSRPNQDIPADLFSAPAVKRTRDYIGLRTEYARLRQVMTDPDASLSDVRTAQDALAKKYDQYVRDHGWLNSKPSRIFKLDSEYPRVMALENVIESLNDATGEIDTTYLKADVFTKRTLGGERTPQTAETTRDAAYISLGMKGRIDVEYIAQLRQQPTDATREELLADETMFLDPQTGEIEFQDEYLSGNVKQKLTSAEQAAKTDAIFDRNVAALKLVQPKPRTLDGADPIVAALGDTWIPTEVIASFAANYMGARAGYASEAITFNDVTDKYTVNVSMSPETKKAKGVYLPRKIIGADEVLEKILNLDVHEDIKITVPRDDDPTRTTSIPYPEGTAAFRTAVNKMQTAFTEFLKSNAKARQATEDAYNDSKNSHRDTVYDGSHLTMPGMNPGIKLRDYQKNVIWRIVKTGKVLMAHAVGAGKTYSLIGAAMELKRLGMAKRSLIVVQNATLGQFARSFMDMYPNANVLVATTADLGRGRRETFLHRIASGDYDAVVIADSTFEDLASSKESEDAYINGILQEAEEELYARRQEEGEKSPTVKALVKYLNSVRNKLLKLSKAGDKARDNQAVTFDDLGVDAIFLDEAHKYKKPFFLTKLKQLVGLNTEPSAVAMSTQAKLATVRSKTGGRNIILATGTPITNTLGEAFHMASYLSPDINREHGVSTFDRFIGSFAKVNPILKQNAGGEMVMKAAIEKFRNGSELITYLRRTWDIVTPDMLRSQINAQAAAAGSNGIPSIRGGVPELVVVPRPKATGRFMNYLLDAYNQYQALPGEGKRDFSYIPILLTGSSRAAAMDLRLIYPDAVADEGGKIDAAANRIWQEYLDSESTKGTQLVFSDIKNPRTMDKLREFMGGVVSNFNTDESSEDEDASDESGSKNADAKAQSFLFDQLTAQLVKKGIPRNQIAYVTDAKTPQQKLALFSRFNSGELRVLMGGTSNLGTGVNVQKKVVALHELDAVYMPSESEQRWARALRFGNTNKEVAIVRYAMKNTLDGAIYDAVLRKTKFIWQVLSGRAGNDFDDPVSEVTISIEEAIASISGSPLPKEKIRLEHEIRELIASRTAFEEQQSAAKLRLEHTQDELARYEKEVVPKNIASAAESKAIADAAIADGAWIDNGDGKRITDPKQLDEFFKKAITRLTSEIVKAAKNASFSSTATRFGERKIQLVGIDTRDYRTKPFIMNGMETWIGVDSIAPVFSETERDVVADWKVEASVRLALPSQPTLNLYHGSAKTATGTYQQIINLTEALDEAVSRNQKRVVDMTEAVKQIQSTIAGEWEDATELAAKQARLEAVKNEIQAASLVDRERDDEDNPPAGPIDVSDLMTPTTADAEDVGQTTNADALQAGDNTTPPEPPKPMDAPPPPGVSSFIAPELQNKQSMGARRRVVFSAADLIADYASEQTSPDIHVGPDHAFEAEWADSRKGLVPRTLFERISDFIRSLPKQMARGAFVELPRTTEFGEARSLLRVAKDAPSVSLWQTGLLLKKTTDAMSEADMDLFARAVVFRDLKNRTGALPFQLSGERAEAERNRVEAKVRNNPVVQSALQYRSEWQEEMKEAYVYWNRRIGIDMSDRLQNKDYFRHQVLWHYRVNESTKKGGQKELRPNLGRGWIKRAYGSELNINANYIQAEWEVATQMIADTVRAEAMAKLIDQYDQMPSLEHAAKMQNLYNFYGGKNNYDRVVKLREKRQKAKRKDKPAISKELKKLDPLFDYRVNIAIASQRLLSMEPWLASLPSAAFFKEVSRMAVDSRLASSEAATAFLGAIQAQEQVIRDTLGDNYRTWRNMVPDTHSAYALRPGRSMFTAYSIPEKLANDLMTGHAQSLQIQADTLREVLVMGHEFTPVVMPNEIVSQLESMAQSSGDTVGAKLAQFFTTMQRKWKGLRLLGPSGFIKYNVRNLTEIDKVLNLIPAAAKWSLLKRSAKELAAVYRKSNNLTDDVRQWMELGGAQAMALPNEMTDLASLKEFERFFSEQKTGLTSVTAKLWNGYWNTAAGISNYRESVLRYSAYLAFKEQLASNDGNPTSYGSSNRKEIDGIRDPDRKAIRLANDVLGDYGDISPVGQALRNGVIPFWAFTEVNFRAYIGGIRNLAYDEKTAIAAGKSIAKAIGVTAIVRSPVLAMKFGKIALLLYGMQAALSTWNILLFGDEEDELPDEVKKRPHIILGRNPDGSIRYFDRLGTSTDFLDWMGLDAIDFTVQAVLDGRMSLLEVAEEIAISPANKLVQSLTPAIKVPAGVLLGKDTFPDIREPRSIRDTGEFVAQAFGAEKAYRVAMGRPTKGRMHDMRSLLWYEVDAGSAAYYRNRDQIAKFTNRGAFSSDSITPRAEALYYYKQALRYGDVRAQAQYRAAYESEGGTEKTLLQSLKMLHPLGTLSVPDEIRYLSKLDRRGKEELAQAEQYFYKHLIAPNEAEAVKASRANRVVDAVKTVLTHSGRPNPATNSDYDAAIEKYESDYADIKQWIESNRELPTVRDAIREVIRSDRFKAIESGTVPQPRPKMANETERKYRERLKMNTQAARQAKDDAKSARQFRKSLSDPATPLN